MVLACMVSGSKTIRRLRRKIKLGPNIDLRISGSTAFVSKFNQSIGKPISVSGFFRCLFEHPGFRGNDDPVQAYCLHGTNAASQIAKLQKKNVSLIALRNIDLTQAFKNKYVISLLAINIK